jgi:uncharacterized protein GlcG (DUF336 family)
MDNRIKWLTLGLTMAAGATRAADVPLAVALEAASAAVEACRADGFHVTATVLDADLSTRVVLRDDGAPNLTVQIGYRKAYTVIKSGMTSGEFGRSVPAQPRPAPGTLPGPVNGDANLITYAGGIAIKSHDAVVGAISVSGAPGGDKDENCAKKALAKVASKLN